ncbi:hypothetical protein GCM10023196_093850 [Actinoallomurus vinaceus]|uniref:Uncharacterized protein n=1 Tax=Actinoallomurus vinaceus TaxID=1080074 RepID=A0ABP8URW3_9ACTN
MNGVDEDATDTSRTTIISRLWARFELLPFRRGVTLVAVLIAVPALLVGGLLVLDGGGKGDRSQHRTAAAAPSARQSDTSAMDRAQRTWGEFVASRSERPASASKSAPPRASQSTTPHSRPAPTTAAPSTGTRCPPELKKWPWMWDLCKHRRGGHGRP